ncbi:MAG: dienelactone hydrolase family protein [Aphanothece sp. CMT-3BRIN-NPC111]|nr:dienelactone hydrolase family protein [Aphanothece sp. CMT-3BRIN-NPC111]
MYEEGGQFEMALRDVEVRPLQDGYIPIRLMTSRGNVDFRYYQVPGAKCGAIWVGGVGGGWDTPAKGLYPQLCQELANKNSDHTSSGNGGSKGSDAIASLRVRFRHPTKLDESVLDVIAGISYLESEGIENIALIGHSFGGAVVIQAAAISENVRSVITLATQSFGTTPVSVLPLGCSILLLHGTVDRVLAPFCSEYAYHLAHEPKRLIFYEGATHGFDEVAEVVHDVIRDWIVDNLKMSVATTTEQFTDI